MIEQLTQSIIVIVVGWYLAWSIIAFFMFAADKRAARHGRQRVREDRLHLLELLGGFPGAILAIILLRHKSRKASFLVVTVLASLANLAILFGLDQLLVRQ